MDNWSIFHLFYSNDNWTKIDYISFLWWLISCLAWKDFIVIRVIKNSGLLHKFKSPEKIFICLYCHSRNSVQFKLIKNCISWFISQTTVKANALIVMCTAFIFKEALYYDFCFCTNKQSWLQDISFIIQDDKYLSKGVCYDSTFWKHCEEGKWLWLGHYFLYSLFYSQHERYQSDNYMDESSNYLAW